MLDVVMVSQYRKIGQFVNVNRLDKPWLIKRLYRLMERMARKINAHKGKDWNNTWGIQVNPEGHDHGFAMTLVGCPIADFAKTHGIWTSCLCSVPVILKQPRPSMPSSSAITPWRRGRTPVIIGT